MPPAARPYRSSRTRPVQPPGYLSRQSRGNIREVADRFHHRRGLWTVNGRDPAAEAAAWNLLNRPRMPGRFQVLYGFLLILLLPLDTVAQSVAPSSYFAIRNRNVYPKPQPPTLGAAGWRFVDPTFGARLLRVTDQNTRPGFPGRSYSTPSAAHQLAWNATSDRFYIRSLDGWFIPYDFDPLAMRSSR